MQKNKNKAPKTKILNQPWTHPHLPFKCPVHHLNAPQKALWLKALAQLEEHEPDTWRIFAREITAAPLLAQDTELGKGTLIALASRPIMHRPGYVSCTVFEGWLETKFRPDSPAQATFKKLHKLLTPNVFYRNPLAGDPYDDQDQD